MPGISGAVGVFFKPGALQTVLRYSMPELSDKPIELEALTGNQFKNVCDQLPELELSKKVQFLEEFLIRYIKADTINTMCCSDRAVNIIVRQKGNVTIEHLADQVNVSRQFLSRQFSERIGISPKHFARIVRFNALHRFLASQPKTRLVDVTYNFGYFDQSHFIKDFIEFMGMSPSEYLVLSTEMADFNAGKIY
jgi:AraC-like DNA-binding protein